MYALAMIAGLLHVRGVRRGPRGRPVVGYAYYVRRRFQAPEAEAGAGADEAEGDASDIRPLRLWVALRWVLRRLPAWSADRSTAAPFVQVTLGLILMVGGAKLFVDAVGNLGKAAGLPPLAFSLLVAPLATELPEKFNSVLWVRRNKDTLAMGNMTGAMVFQSSFPVNGRTLADTVGARPRSAGRGRRRAPRGLRPLPHASGPRASVRATPAAAGRVLRRVRRVRRHEALNRATAGSRWGSAARSSST